LATLYYDHPVGNAWFSAMRLIDGPRSNARHKAVKFAIFLLFASLLVSLFWHTNIPGWALFFLLNTGFFIYWAPTFFAAWTNRPNLASIMAINTFLGFSGVGWVAALAWAFLDSTGEERQAGLNSVQTQLRDCRKELDVCKKQIDELRGHVILLSDHQTLCQQNDRSHCKAEVISLEKQKG
jgi:hypothetical protein